MSFLTLSALSKSKQYDGFTLEYSDKVSEQDVREVSRQINNAISMIKAYLSQSVNYRLQEQPSNISIFISDTHRFPYQEGTSIYIPEKRVLALSSIDSSAKSKRGLGIVHELVHVFAISAYRMKKLKEIKIGFTMMDSPFIYSTGLERYLAIQLLVLTST